jgi:predicted SnoaL-like aldol condensation-catalyzing enzyme
MGSQVTSNLDTVRALLETAFNARQPSRAAALYVSPAYRQQDSGAAGAAAFVRLANDYLRDCPQLRLDVQLLLGDGAWVVAQSRIRRFPDDPGRAVMDTFQLAGGRVVAHWDVLQCLPENVALAGAAS